MMRLAEETKKEGKETRDPEGNWRNHGAARLMMNLKDKAEMTNYARSGGDATAVQAIN